MAAPESDSPIAKRHYRITLADALSAHDRALATGGMAGLIRWQQSHTTNKTPPRGRGIAF